MAESLINISGERETLANGVDIIRQGNLRTLQIYTATYGTLSSIVLPKKDWPTHAITCFCLKHYNGSYGAMAVFYISTSGQIYGGTYWNAYHGSASGTSIVPADHIIGEVTWSIV